MSIVLLSAAALAMIAGTRATALLTDDATLVARAHALGAASAERVHGAPCSIDDREATTTLPRVRLDEMLHAGSRLQRVQVAASLHFSPLARSTPAALGLSSARLCP